MPKRWTPIRALLPPLVVVALRLWRGVHPGVWKRALPKALAAILLCDVGVGLFRGGASTILPAGLGGAVGLGSAAALDLGLDRLHGLAGPAVRAGLMALFLALGLAAAFWSLQLDAEERRLLFRRRVRPAPAAEPVAPEPPAAEPVAPAPPAAADPTSAPIPGAIPIGHPATP